MPYIDWTGEVELRETEEGYAIQPATIHVLGEQLDRTIREMFPQTDHRFEGGRSVTTHGRLHVRVESA
jgi:hypothetical protein